MKGLGAMSVSAVCCVGGLPATDEYADYWSKAGCTFEVIIAKEFQCRFYARSARPLMSAIVETIPVTAR